MFGRRILNVPENSSIIGVLGELGFFPLDLSAKLNVVKYWYRLASIKASPLAIDAYKLSMKLFHDDHHSWYKSLRSVMSAHGLEQAMLCPDVAMCIFPTVVQESFMAEWGLDLSRPLAKKGDGENKLRTYRLFKDSFHFENYLDNVKIKKHRVALTRFRLSCHNLQIEAGRHHIPKIPYDRRLCEECGVIQDEIHALLFCCLYSEYREGFMKVFHE